MGREQLGCVLATVMLAVGLTLDGGVLAQGRVAAGEESGAGFGATALKGLAVQGRGGQQLGTVEELIFDARGQVRYLAMRFDRPGEGSLVTAIPWGMVHASTATVKVDLDPAVLAAAPVLDPGELRRPDIARWGPAIDRYFSSAPTGLAADAPSFEEMDTNHDGQISLSEARNLSGAYLSNPESVYSIFGHADGDENNRIDRAEFAQFAEEMAAEGAAEAPPVREGPRRPIQPDPGPLLPDTRAGDAGVVGP